MNGVSLILDIGNGSLGAALVRYEPSDDTHSPISTVLYSHREPLTFLTDVTEKRLTATMLDLLKTTLSHIRSEAIQMVPKGILGGVRFDHVVCIFSSPWYISQTSKITKESETPFYVTNAIVNELVNEEEIRFANALERGDYEEHFGTKVVLLERALVHTAVNGYEVANPVGKSARSLEITLFTSLISEKILRLVEDIFYRAFHVRQIECFSYALASWNAIRVLFPNIDDFIFLDVGGETSDVTITIRGAVTETISFPFGRSTILRALVENVKISPETAVSLTKMRAAGTLEESAAIKVEETLQTISDQWTNRFNETLSTISKKYNLPKQIFVTVDPDFASFFSGILNRADIGPALFKGPFAVTIVDTNTIAPFIRTANQSSTEPTFLPGATDSALAIETIFFSIKKA